MPRIDPQTRTAQFFLARYGKATIDAAVEAAADAERENLLPGQGKPNHIPVDVAAIAAKRNIRIAETSDIPQSCDAQLLAVDTGYFLRMDSNRSSFRKRFSIAHEIGHTLFFEGQRHAIGALSKKEIETEEGVCDLFAAALLMPQLAMRNLCRGIRGRNPWEVLQAIDVAARRMQVSLHAFILRMLKVRARTQSTAVILCLRCFPNLNTGESACLRVETAVSLGGVSNIRTWRNKSATGVNLLSAVRLFEAWRDIYGLKGEPSGGRYMLTQSGLVRASESGAQWTEEELLLEVKGDASWKNKESVRMKTANCLYAASGWKDHQVYVVSILQPVEVAQSSDGTG